MYIYVSIYTFMYTNMQIPSRTTATQMQTTATSAICSRMGRNRASRSTRCVVVSVYSHLWIRMWSAYI